MKKGNPQILAILSLIYLAVFATSCIEEIETNSLTFEKLLVVDANISDQAKAHEVRLFYTSPIDDEVDITSNVLSGATVWVEDDLGHRVDFTEQSAGLYVSPSTFAGQSGRSYALFITTREGKRYESPFEKMVAAPEISTIYNQFSVETVDQTGSTEPGAQFFIDVENADQSSQFYRYEWTDTHQIITPYLKKYVATPVYQDLAMWYEITPFDGDVSECYRERRFDELILATSTNNSNGELREVPIRFAPASDFEVTTMYSIEVTQRAISAQAYSYYRKIELFNESNGSLFDKQQGVIVGNISSIDSPDEKVLGYFEVSGASSKRVFLNIPDLDEEVREYIVRPCERYPALEYEGRLVAFYEASDVPEAEQGDATYLRAFYELYNYDEESGTKFLAHRLCIDCTRRGSLGKPDYWP